MGCRLLWGIGWCRIWGDVIQAEIRWCEAHLQEIGSAGEM